MNRLLMLLLCPVLVLLSQQLSAGAESRDFRAPEPVQTSRDLDASGDNAARQSREWLFQVVLDDRPIGTHRFRLLPDGDRFRVVSTASYQVKWLFFTAYSYRHRAEEVWQDGCLRSIESTTLDGGKSYELHGEPSEGGMRLVVNDSVNDYPQNCIRSFAYWDSSLLEQTRLLNPQTGELEPVELLDKSPEQPAWLPVTAATKLRLSTRKMPIDLWYSQDGRWLALEARLESGQVVRYLPLPTTVDLQELAGEF